MFQDADITLRLSDGGEAHGRVEVLYEDMWGTVCHNSFDKNDTNVICHQLGFPRNAGHGYKGYAAFGHGPGPILLDALGCLGGESNLKYCSHRGWGYTPRAPMHMMPVCFVIEVRNNSWF